MKPAHIFALAVASTAAIASVNAQTYQWKDSSGRTVISDTPPPGNARDARAMGTSTPTTSSAANKPAEAPKSMAEKELDFKKRQMDAAEKEAKEAKEKAAAAERKDDCERAKRNLAMLESGQRMSTSDSNGERHIMEDAERQREIERTRKIMAESCK